MSKWSRNKGHGFERLVSNLLKPIFPNARRQLEYHVDDAKGVDIQGTDHYKIQCKKCAKYVSINTIDEIKCHRFLGDVPVLVTAADNKPAMAVLHFDDLIKLIADAKAYEAMTMTKNIAKGS